MKMITSEDMRIYATERYTCKCTFLVTLMNKFGEQGGYGMLLDLIKDPEISLDNLANIV